MSTPYDHLTRDQLIARLKMAEDVCVLYGWCPVRGTSDREEAANQMWQMWASHVDSEFTSPDTHADLVRLEPQLAAARRATRAATLKFFFGDDGDG